MGLIPTAQRGSPASSNFLKMMSDPLASIGSVSPSSERYQMSDLIVTECVYCETEIALFFESELPMCKVCEDFEEALLEDEALTFAEGIAYDLWADR